MLIRLDVDISARWGGEQAMGHGMHIRKFCSYLATRGSRESGCERGRSQTHALQADKHGCNMWLMWLSFPGLCAY